MSTVENKVIVRIFGEEYPITGSTDPDYISRIASYLDSRMQEVSKRANTQSREKVAILTALSLASELHEKSENLAHVDHRNERLDHLLDELDSALNEPPSSGQ